MAKRGGLGQRGLDLLISVAPGSGEAAAEGNEKNSAESVPESGEDKVKSEKKTGTKSSGKAEAKSTGKTAAKTAGKTAGKTSGKTAAKAVGKTKAQSADKNAEKAAGKTTAKSAGKTSGKTAGKTAAKATGKTEARSADKNAEKAAGKTAAKSAGKTRTKGTGKSPDASTDNVNAKQDNASMSAVTGAAGSVAGSAAGSFAGSAAASYDSAARSTAGKAPGSGTSAEEPVHEPLMVPIGSIEPNRDQPRKNFDEDSLQELADSVKQYGVIQPLIVQKKEDYYEIIAGERRWRAAKIAGIKKLPVILKDYTPREVMEISLIENLQREDLNPIEEAMAYRNLMEEYHLRQDEVAQKVSRSRAAIANSVRLLNLDSRVQEMVVNEMLSTGHARALLGITDPELQFSTAQRAFDEQMSVREVEKLVKKLTSAPPCGEKAACQRCTPGDIRGSGRANEIEPRHKGLYPAEECTEREDRDRVLFVG